MSCLSQGKSFFGSMLDMYRIFNCNIFNLSDIFWCVCWYQKILMILAGILFLISPILGFKEKEDGLYIIIFSFLKTYILRWKPKY